MTLKRNNNVPPEHRTLNPDPAVVVAASIRRKLTAIIMGVSAASLVLAGGLIVLTQMSAFRKSMARDHVQQAQMVAKNCQAAVSFDDAQDATTVLRTLASRNSLAYASVSKADGELLASYRREGFVGEPQPHPMNREHTLTADWLLAQSPIVLPGGQVIGRAFLQSDLRELVDFRMQIIEIVAACLIAIILMAWVVSLHLQKLISEPIEQLTALVRNVSRHRDYSIRASDLGKDEIGVLARAFNEMLSEVELRDEKLREREQRTLEYLNIAGVMIIALDTDGRVTLINPKGCEVLGLKECDVIGRSWVDDFIPEGFRNPVKKAFQGLVQSEGSAVQCFENKILAGSGNERLIAWNNSVIRDKAGHVLFILSSGEDITDKRQAEARENALREQLSRAERMETIGVLAGGVAHDLNNILGPMVMIPEFIEDDLGAALQGDKAAHEEILESIGVMKTSANRAASVVRDLLALSRRGHYERIPTNINKLSCLTRSSGAIRNLGTSYPNVNIELHTSSEALMVLGSEDHLCRVMDNLIRNAVESIDGKGTVAVTTTKRHLDEPHHGYVRVPPGDYAIIEVADTGSGIENDHITRIFEPFYTKKKKTERSGSGLGLSIVHGIVEDHKGFIDVASTVGRGTTFSLYIPLTAAPESTSALDDRPLISGKGRILVVDDEPGQRFLASTCLTRLGYTVGLADDGHAAVRFFAMAKELRHASPYDLIVLDMRMEPGFDGLDTLRAIRELYPQQKVLIASGHAEDDRSSAALDLGAKWLGKPYGLNEMSNAVAELLKDIAT